MKKGLIVFVSLIAAAIAFPASAQKLQFGVEAGANMSWADWDLKKIYEKESIYGGTAAFTAEYALTKKLWLQSAIRFSSKGAKSSALSTGGDGAAGKVTTRTYRAIYAEIPVTVAYKVRISDKINFICRAGGFLSEGIWGEYKSKDVFLNGNKRKYPAEDLFSGDILKGFDAGITAGIGAEYKRFALRADVDWSLLNIAKKEDAVRTDNFKNRSLSLVIGYKFR